MLFCKICDNMLYTKIDENSLDLSYNWLNCGYIIDDKKMLEKSYKVYENNMDNGKRLSNNINKYTIHDPTLPRIRNMSCPNNNCKSNTDDTVKNEVIYIRYNTNDMKYVYICCNCNSYWENMGSQKSIINTL